MEDIVLLPFFLAFVHKVDDKRFMQSLCFSAFISFGYILGSGNAITGYKYVFETLNDFL